MNDGVNCSHHRQDANFSRWRVEVSQQQNLNLALASRDDHCSYQGYQGGDKDTNEYLIRPRYPEC